MIENTVLMLDTFMTYPCDAINLATGCNCNMEFFCCTQSEVIQLFVSCTKINVLIDCWKNLMNFKILTLPIYNNAEKYCLTCMRYNIACIIIDVINCIAYAIRQGALITFH